MASYQRIIDLENELQRLEEGKSSREFYQTGVPKRFRFLRKAAAFLILLLLILLLLLFLVLILLKDNIHILWLIH